MKNLSEINKKAINNQIRTMKTMEVQKVITKQEMNLKAIKKYKLHQMKCLK